MPGSDHCSALCHGFILVGASFFCFCKLPSFVCAQPRSVHDHLCSTSAVYGTLISRANRPLLAAFLGVISPGAGCSVHPLLSARAICDAIASWDA